MRAVPIAALVVLTMAAPPADRALATRQILRRDGSVDWTRYHDSAAATLLLRELAARYPRADHCLKHPDGLRSTVRPWDDDGDGSLDEDPAEDLDGDGEITSMRVPSPPGFTEGLARRAQADGRPRGR